ncbi:antitoxin VbhA family protein [Terriglobus sp.]|uniref:antitoxin VbhA family protein n=1 Tax=Terriglobus sp. TaxID=1889013 RepID=UPI003B00179E
MSTSTTALPHPAGKHPPEVREISGKARMSRAAAIASANGHNAMEGLFPSTFSQDLQKRYMEGEIEIEEAVQAARRHYGLS